jgi:hypothetical protein
MLKLAVRSVAYLSRSVNRERPHLGGSGDDFANLTDAEPPPAILTSIATTV